ncbi:MAG: TrkA family potassium uptake protein [Chloroflexota bacterium]|nr:TrkA family potassium uptake protein [Chloroflexota bacterium]
MRAFIAGCGRTGASLAERLAEAGHEVTIIDTNTEAFNRLDHGFPGRALRADVTDEDQLRRAGAEGVDLFFALTEGDNRNILAAQSAAETLGIERVVAKVNDPVRAEAYRALGLATLCRTRILADALATWSGLPHEGGAEGVAPATGHHQAHHEETAGQSSDGTAVPAGGR